MGFESTVFNVVNPCLTAGEQIELYNGTLFLDCSEKTARNAFSELFTKVSTMIQISKVGPDSYVIDFVAKNSQHKTEDFSPFATVNS